MILNHGFRVDPSAWNSEVPDASNSWPASLDSLPHPKDGQKILTQQRRITRQDVFSLAESSTNSVQSFVAVSVWGCGMRVLSRRRCLKALGGKGAVSVEKAFALNLDQAIDISRNYCPIDAYRALHGKGTGEGALRIHGLGPAYGTKVLYFASYNLTESELKPLILDSFVSKAINVLCGTTWPEGDFSAAIYRQYLEIAHEWASDWGTQADVIERILFAVGQSDPLAIKAFL